MKKLNFIFGVHNHQPVGNFDFVLEEACEKAYFPFFNILKDFPDVRIMAHFSGCLIDWLDDNKPEYFDLIGELVERGQIGLLGSGYYEPVLTMIPEHDRHEQIKRMELYLKKKFKRDVRGIWLTERVWEPGLASSLANAGVEYVIMDDYHLKAAGCDEEEINGYFITEDEGYPVALFPINEKLRYLIPFAKPEDTMEYLRSRLNDDPNNLLVMIDDGEKFGVWPNTYKPVYEDGWLERFFGLLSDNRDWIEMRHCAEFMKDVSPRRLIHVPNNSYFEMSIWSLPARKASRLKALTQEAQSGQDKKDCLPFIRGGIWRGFLSKYPESNMMQKWMLKISNDLEGILGRGETTKEFLLESKTHLLRGQCNCPYWHGVFGGLYLPHLRHAVYSELVAAQRKLDQLRHRETDFLRAEETDLDCDGRKEIILNNRYFTIVFKPSYGGSIPLLAFKDLDYNFQNTLSRRYEHYHDEIIAASVNDGSKGTSIHELKRDTPDDVKHSLSYDWHLKYSLLDHMFDENVSVDNIYTAQFRELGDFVDQPYEHKILQTPSEISITFTREGHLHLTDEKAPLLITKNIYFRKDEARLRAVYKYKNISQQRRTIYPGIEWNFFLLGGDDERKSYKFNDLEPVTPLDQKLTAENVTQLEIEDGVLGFRLTLKWNSEGGCFVVPVKTVSQSEGGYDLIFQGSSVIPHWSFDLKPDEEATIALTLVAEEV